MKRQRDGNKREGSKNWQTFRRKYKGIAPEALCIDTIIYIEYTVNKYNVEVSLTCTKSTSDRIDGLH